LTLVLVLKWVFGGREGVVVSSDSFEQFEDAVGRIESALIGRFMGLREQGLKPDLSMVWLVLM